MGNIAAHGLRIRPIRAQALVAGPGGELLEVDPVGTARACAGVASPQILLEQLDRRSPSREALLVALHWLDLALHNPPTSPSHCLRLPYKRVDSRADVAFSEVKGTFRGASVSAGGSRASEHDGPVGSA